MFIKDRMSLNALAGGVPGARIARSGGPFRFGDAGAFPGSLACRAAI